MLSRGGAWSRRAGASAGSAATNDVLVGRDLLSTFTLTTSTQISVPYWPLGLHQRALAKIGTVDVALSRRLCELCHRKDVCNSGAGASWARLLPHPRQVRRDCCPNHHAPAQCAPACSHSDLGPIQGLDGSRDAPSVDAGGSHAGYLRLPASTMQYTLHR